MGYYPGLFPFGRWVVMKAIIQFSMKNTVALLIIIAMILAGGFMSVQKMNIEEFPNVDIPYLGVFLLYPGSSPEQAMNDVGKPLEAQFKNIDGVKNIYSQAMANGFYATLEFDMDVSLDEGERAVRDAIAQVSLPDTVENPEFHRQSPTGNPSVYSVGIYADEDQEKVEDYVKEMILPQLEGIKGIEKIELSGAEDKKVFVKVRPEALKEHNLTLEQVKQAIISNNLSVPTGEMVLSDRLLPIRVSKKLTSVEDIKNISLLMVNQDMSSLTDAMNQFGDGMKQLGEGMQEIGTGLERIGEVQGLQQAQIQILVALQGLSAQLINDQLELQKLLAQEQLNPGSVPKKSLQELQTRIKVNETQIVQLQQKFQETSNKIAAIGKELSKTNAAPSPQSSSEATEHSSKELGPKLSVKSITLGEIADVAYETEQDTNYTRINGKPGVILRIIPEGGQNVVAIVNEVKKTLENNPFPPGYDTEVLRDQSIKIKESVYSMLREAILGAIMAVIVTLLFLRNLRSTLIAIISIPLSILASFMALHYLGYTLNLLTLSGIAVAVGRVVDDSIVVIENIFRRLRLSNDKSSQLVESSTREVATAITSSTITTVAVFLPLAFVEGIVGRFFAPLAWTVVISLLFSLLVAVTVVPLFSRLFLLKLKTVEHKENQLQRIYRRTLQWALGHRLAVLGIAILLLVASAAFFVPQLGFNFLPQENILDYSVNIEMPIATSPAKVDEVARKVEGILLGREEIKRVSSSVFGQYNQANVSFVVKDEVEDVDGLIKELRDAFDQIKGTESITISGVGGIAGGQTSEFVLVVNGPNIQDIKKASEQMVQSLKSVPGLADVRSSAQGEMPEVMLRLNEEKLAEHGFYPGLVGLNLRNLISGESITKVEIDSKTTDLILGLKMDEVNSIDALGDQTITNILGEHVAIKEIADVEEVKSPRSITHLNQKEYVMIHATITEQNTGEVISKATEAINQLKLPPGVSWYKEGASEAMAEGFTNMGIAILLSVLLVFLVLVISFGGSLTPFVILFSMPLTIIGGLCGLYIIDEPIGMPAMIGQLMLNGIVVTNAIVLIDRVKQNEKLGMGRREAILEAGVTRIRPILMTAIATIGALAPLSISTSGGLLSKSLAVVVIGGLTTSTLLTLIVVPVLYSLFHPEKKVKQEAGQTAAV